MRKFQHIERAPMIMLSVWMLTSMSWWALAFWPVVDNASWVARTQYVCFGKLPGQVLPLSGWLLLFGAPALLLLSMFVVYSSEIKEAVSHYKITVLILLIAFSAELVWVAHRMKQESELSKSVFLTQQTSSSLPAEYPIGTADMPNFSLIDQFGNKISTQGLKGQTVVFSFVFAHCAAVCPMLVRQVDAALEKLSNISNLKGVLVTLDPWRDRPTSLPNIAKEWELKSNVHLLSGPIKDVVKLHKDFKIPVERNEKTGDVVHPSLIYVINPEGKLAYSFNNPPVQWIVDAVNKINGR